MTLNSPVTPDEGRLYLNDAIQPDTHRHLANKDSFTAREEAEMKKKGRKKKTRGVN